MRILIRWSYQGRIPSYSILIRSKDLGYETTLAFHLDHFLLQTPFYFPQISNNGEFVDNIYREQDPSKIVGRLIGRNQVQTNAKKVYTTADIVCETYLHKKGSWMQNWKRRYFVLRKDIRSICYYDNRENLTLLGSIPLDSETVITPVPPKDASKCIVFS